MKKKVFVISQRAKNDMTERWHRCQGRRVIAGKVPIPPLSVGDLGEGLIMANRIAVVLTEIEAADEH